MELNYAITQETIDEGFTQSELALMDECALKWNFRYNNRLNKADTFDWNLHVGSAWHSFQEGWRRKHFGPEVVFEPEIPKGVLQDHEFEKTKEYWEHILPAFQEAYVRLYPTETNEEWDIIEEELSAEFSGYQIRGKIDLASDKLNFIRDFKTTASAWLISGDGWHFKLQFMLYCWLMTQNFAKWQNRMFNFQMDIMQKPALKHTQKESWAGHLQRVRADILARPEFYLRRESFKITPGMIQRFEEHVLYPKLARIQLAEWANREAEPPDSILINPNTNACNAYGKQCEFFNICEKGWDAGQFFFQQRAVKHPEL